MIKDVLPSLDAKHSHPLKQQTANLIQYKVVTSATHNYNITNTFNKLLSHQFTFNVPHNETAEICSFCCCFIVHTTTLVLHPNDPSTKFIYLEVVRRSILPKVLVRESLILRFILDPCQASQMTFEPLSTINMVQNP